jgi:hypothetical protein
MVFPRDGEVVYAGSTITVIVKPDPSEKWDAVSFGFDAMVYDPLSNQYKINIRIPDDYFGYYDNLVVIAGDKNGNTIELKGRILVKLPPNLVLQSISVDSYKTLYKLPPGSSIDEMQRIESRQLNVEGTYSDGIERDLTSSTTGTTYTSSDEKVVAVNSEGKMTARNIGTAKITVKNGNLSAEVKVVVKPYKK